MERVMKMDDGQMMRDLKKLGGKRALLDLGGHQGPHLA